MNSPSSTHPSERSHALRALGKYRIIADIGYGGMAEVFLGVMEGPAQFSKLIALKVLRPQFAEDPDGLAMFLDEARLAARLNHPNIVQTYEVGAANDRHYIAMEYLEGQSFSRVLKLGRTGRAERAMPLEMSLRVIAESLAGLHYAHELKDFSGEPLHLVHRDVSPHNVFITYDGTIKMLDFGIAKAVGGSSTTRTGVLKGKVGYMAPEQIFDDGVDRRADVYAVGVMLWEVIASRRLWAGANDVAVLTKVANESVPEINTIATDIPEELARICMKAVSRKREDRYSNAAEFQQALEEYLDSSSARALPRDVGKHVSRKFEQVRDDTRKVIDQQLARAKELLPATSGAFAPVSLPTASGATPSLLLERNADLSGPGQIPSTLISSSSQEMSGSSIRPNQSKSSTLALLLGLAALAVIGFGAWSFVAKRTPPQPQTAAATATTQASGSTQSETNAAPPITEVDILINAEPPDAKLFVDDVQLGTNPYVKKLARDGAKHIIRAEAAGYLPDAQEVVADANKSVNFQLRSTKQAAAAPAVIYRGGKPAPVAKSDPSPTPAAQPAPAPAPAPAQPAADPKSARGPKIDTDNPFEKK